MTDSPISHYPVLLQKLGANIAAIGQFCLAFTLGALFEKGLAPLSSRSTDAVRHAAQQVPTDMVCTCRSARLCSAGGAARMHAILGGRTYVGRGDVRGYDGGSRPCSTASAKTRHTSASRTSLSTRASRPCVLPHSPRVRANAPPQSTLTADLPRLPHLPHLRSLCLQDLAYIHASVSGDVPPHPAPPAPEDVQGVPFLHIPRALSMRLRVIRTAVLRSGYACEEACDVVPYGTSALAFRQAPDGAEEGADNDQRRASAGLRELIPWL